MATQTITTTGFPVSNLSGASFATNQWPITTTGLAGAKETTPPVVSNVSPAPPGPITRLSSISFDVTDETLLPPLAEVVVQAVYGAGPSEVVHDGTSFVAPYTGTRTPITGGYSYTVSCTGEGWKHASTSLRILAVDGSGNLTNELKTFTVTDPPASPTVGNFVPPVLSSILRTDTISFDVTDTSGFSRIVVQAQRGSGQVEVIHDGTSFRGVFTGSRTPITDGYAYVVQRTVYGWPEANLIIRVFAFDLDGNQSSPTDFNYTVTNPLNPEEVVVYYKMRALADPGPGYVTWVVPGTPDTTGTFAPSAVQVGTIVIAAVWS